MPHAQQEALAAAVEAVRSKQMSVRAAAAAFGVSRGSLYRRASGQVELSARNGPAPVLTDGEVRKVLEAVRDRAERGERMANAELAAFVRTVVGNSPYQRDMPAHFPSMRWVQRFTSKHRELFSTTIPPSSAPPLTPNGSAKRKRICQNSPPDAPVSASGVAATASSLNVADVSQLADEACRRMTQLLRIPTVATEAHVVGEIDRGGAIYSQAQQLNHTAAQLPMNVQRPSNRLRRELRLQMQLQNIQLRREMRRNQNALMLQLRQINARLWNQQAANLNRLCIHADSQAAIALRAFQKMNPGIGAGLPGVGVPRRQLPVLNVGDVVPGPFFPADWSVLESWQHADINALSIILNDNFGITRKEPLHILRERLHHFLMS